MNRQQLVDDTAAIIALQTELYRRRSDETESKKRVEEYLQLAENSEQIRQDIEAIVAQGRGQAQAMTRDTWIPKVNRLMTLLFSNPLTGKVEIPSSFWQGALGQLINLGNKRLVPFLTASILNPTDAAKVANVSRKTIYDWIEQGKILPIWEHNHLFLIEIEVVMLANKMRHKTRQSSDDLVDVAFADTHEDDIPVS